MEYPLLQLRPDADLGTDIDKVSVQVRRLSVVLSRNGRLPLTPAGVARKLKARLSSRSRITDDDDHRHRQEKQLLLDTVDADFLPGAITAIIGASGSGKTTLLNAVAGRLPGGTSVTEGTVRWNRNNGGLGLDRDSVRLAYLAQHDVLIPSLTVRETLTYAASLRLPASTGSSERRRIVQDVIEELRLGRCADTRIGDGWKRGCSGGEKRRVSIGVQLLSNPSLLLLDEPTTGLDAASALSVVKTLRQLAARGRTVVVTLHQPRMEIWSLVENVVVLAPRGMPVYSGPVSGSLPWLEAQGLSRPDFVNAADFIIDVTAVDGSRVRRLQAAWREEARHRFPLETTPALNLTGDEPMEESVSAGDRSRKARCTLFLRRLSALTSRTAKITYRDRLGMTASVMEAILVGLTVGYMFLHLGRDQAGIRARQGCLYVAASLQGYLVLIFETYRLSSDMPVFEAEAAERCVNPYTFLLSRRLARLPTEDLPVPLILSCLVYFMAGFDSAADRFGTFLAVTVANHYVAILCATACVALGRDFARASLIASLSYTLQSLASGMIIQIDTMPAYVRWTRWITYTVRILLLSQCLSTCSDYSPVLYLPGSGDFVIMSLGFPRQWARKAIAVLLVFILFFGLVSILGFSYVKPMSLSKAYSPSARPEAAPVHPAPPPELSRAISRRPHLPVELDGVRVGLRTRSIRSLGRWGATRNIVGPMTLTFDAGMLNIVLGPSGSGKSSLLGAIGGRLRNTGRVSYVSSGTISLGGGMEEVSDNHFPSRYSLVPQADEMLLPALTVRETLRYAAALRLPTAMSDAQRHDKVEDVLRKMGLVGCADSLVGSDVSFRGISGGEKRRLTLAVQILTDPQVLLVDEPTSGLDAFTALTVMQVLRSLAEEGRAVIVALHQPRSDMFDLFGNVLLLDREGAPAYFGRAGDMVEYLGGCGHECPSDVNPADFALDVVSSLQGSLVVRGQENLPGKQPSVLVTDCRDTELHRGQQQHGEPFLRRGQRSTNVLIRRAVTNMRRQGRLVLARLMQPSGVAILFALFFAGLDADYRSLQTRLGFYQQLGGFYVIGVLTNAAVYPDERDLARRETEDAAYSLDAFLAAYTAVELPFEVVSALFFGLLSVFAVGFPREAATYLTASLACFTGLSCGESLGIVFHTLLPGSAGFAINLMGVLLVVANTMAGVLVIDMPAVFDAMNYLSPIRYQVRGLAYYTLRDVVFDCPFDGGASSCPLRSGREALELYEFDGNPLVSVGGMVACVVVYRLVAWLVLRTLG